MPTYARNDEPSYWERSDGTVALPETPVIEGEVGLDCSRAPQSLLRATWNDDRATIAVLIRATSCIMLAGKKMLSVETTTCEY